jgi:hypothetical protein
MTLNNEILYSLSGKITHMNLPVAGTTVRVFDCFIIAEKFKAHFVAEQITNNKGEFSFSLAQGTYVLEIKASGESRFANFFIENVCIDKNTVLPIKLASACMLSGIVKFDNEKFANEIVKNNVEVIVTSPELPHYFVSKLDKNNYYNFALVSGRYQIALRHNNFIFNKPISFEIAADKKLDILINDLVEFKGKITDGDSNLIANCIVQITLANSQIINYKWQDLFFCETVSNDQGEFIFWLSPDKYNLELVPPIDTKLAFQQITAISIFESIVSTYVLQTGYYLKGKVSYPSQIDAKLPPLSISVNNESDVFSQFISESGEFSFTLSPDNYQIVLTAQPDALLSSPLQIASHSAKVLVDKDINCDIELKEGFLIGGKISNWSSQARSNLLLSFYQVLDRDEKNFSKSDKAVAITKTNEDGAYKVRLEPDKYWLLVNNQLDSAKFFDLKEESLDAHAAGEFDQVCLLVFEINASDGMPIENCLISWQSYEKTNDAPQSNYAHEFAAYTDMNGFCKITLGVGIYSFQIEPPANSKLQNKHIRQLSVSKDLERKVKLAYIGS